MSESERFDDLRNQYRRTLKLLVQSMAHTPYLPIGETELHEALAITEDVIMQRLLDDRNLGHDEWKGDKKKKYAHLFRSIRDEIDLSIQIHFNVSDRNFVARQFLGHVVDPLLAILKIHGPESVDLTPDLIEAGHEAVNNLARDYSTQDSMIAKHILVSTAQAHKKAIEAKKQRRWAKQARLITIKEAVEALRM